MPIPIEHAASRRARASRSPSTRPAALLPGGPPRVFAARLALGAPLLGGALWYARLALQAGAPALGLTPAHTVAQTIAAIILTPACVAFAAALADGAWTLLRGQGSAGTWSRVMAEALAGLVLGAFVGVLQPAVWPGLAALGIAAALGLTFGFVHWQPQAATGEVPDFVPFWLLLFDEPRAQAAARPAATPARERQAA